MKLLATLLVILLACVASADACTYTVRRGDSGWRISRSLGISLSRLQSLNGGNLNRLRIGQVLLCGTARPPAHVATRPAARPTTFAAPVTSGERCRHLTSMFCGRTASCNARGGLVRTGQCSGRRAADNVCCDTTNVGSSANPTPANDAAPPPQQSAPAPSGGATSYPGPYGACTGRCRHMTCRGRRVQFSRFAVAGTRGNISGRYSSADLDTLTRTLFGEAGNEEPAGVAAVAWTIVNRMLASRWPSTIARVCRQRLQYSCWNGGSHTRRMQRLQRSSSQYQRLQRIAKDVLDGRTPDFTGGANHYFARYIATPSWACQMSPTMAVGVHQFFRSGAQVSA